MSTKERNNENTPPPFDLKTFVGIEATPGVDPSPEKTTDISDKLQTEGCTPK